MRSSPLVFKAPLSAVFLAGLLSAAPSYAQELGQGQAIVTVLPKHAAEAAPNVTQQDITQVKVNGKDVKVTSFAALRGQQNPVELVVMIDDSARTSLGRQLNDIDQFVRSLPANVAVGIAYMENGRAVFTGPLTLDRAQALKALHLPSGAAGVDSSPYFCLSDLARRWPSQNRAARREVVMLTDGVDNYEHRFDPDDPYVQAAITDSIRAGLVVYSIYWKDLGRFDSTYYANNSGENLLTEVTESTGGRNFWQGLGNPVSFQPYFDELVRRLNNQYEIGFAAPLNGKPEVETFKLKLTAPGADVEAPQQVLVAPSASAKE
jgi:hypothetical protein